jgi:lipoprotein-releasing system permease protein
VSFVLDIALTHLRSRVRQTVVGVLGVATGVGFSIMMAALMEGSQEDFIRQLVDSLPHISVTDETRNPPRQPAEAAYDAVQIDGLRTPVIRPGIKNPMAIMAAIESWLPGAIAPSVQAKAVIRYAGRDTATAFTGLDPKREQKVSKLATQLRQGSLDALYKATNALILGDGLARKIGARVGNTVTIVSGAGRTLDCTIVGIAHTGVAQIDDTASYGLIKTGQILASQIGLVNELRIRAGDALQARTVAARIEGETGYKSVSWQEAHEDLLSAFEVRNIIMYTVVGAILLVASFGTFNIVSTITHEKARDIAIMKSLGFRAKSVRRIFIIEAAAIGLVGALIGWALGYVLTRAMGSVEIKSPFMDTSTIPVLYSPLHYALATVVALASSLFAGYFPARKAAAVEPVDIIRGAS